MKSILWTRKIILPTLLVLVFSAVMVSVGTASPIPAVTQTDSTTIVFLDPPTINGTAIGINNTITVDINIRDAVDIHAWQAGLIFNPTLLECTDFEEGDFLSNIGDTIWSPGAINNTAGLIAPYGGAFLTNLKASGSGRLANATFKVLANGLSDLHFRDVIVAKTVWNPASKRYDAVMVPFNIIDVYTVVLDGTPHKVVTVSNSTGYDVGELQWIDSVPFYPVYHSGFSNYAFNEVLEELSFNVTGPYQGFSNVTIPQALLEPKDESYGWGVIIDGSPVFEKTVAENTTHTSIYFTYSKTDHEVQITTRFVKTTISMDLSSTSVTTGSTITISGGITPVRTGANVTIEFRESGAVTWTTITTVITDSNGNYTSSWTTEKTGTYEVRARWSGDETYLGAASEPVTVEVKGKGGIPLEILIVAVGAIIAVVVIVIVVYFVKIRKSKPV